ncbi:MAG: hypothetical protein COB66_05330, partial [Coxiella sp. (in: Bacteria)]
MKWITVMLCLLVSVGAYSTSTPSDDSIAMIKITVSDANTVNDIADVNYQKSLLQLTLAPDTPVSVLAPWLNAISQQAKHNKLIAGVVINSDQPLSKKEAGYMAAIARKSSFLSTTFQFKQASQWKAMFRQERRNKNLMTTVYGATAVAQLQQTPSLASYFVNARVPFVHLLSAPTAKRTTARKFWMSVARATYRTRQPIAFMVLDSGSDDVMNYASIVNATLPRSYGYMQWVGGDDARKFNPISLTATSLTVWRDVRGKAQDFSYVRDTSPTGLFRAMGTSRQAYTILSTLIQRTQVAAKADITFLGDAEDNLHTEGVLVSLAAAAINDRRRLYLPKFEEGMAPSKFDMLMYRPYKQALKRL